jgi:hypothetical protein
VDPTNRHAAPVRDAAQTALRGLPPLKDIAEECQRLRGELDERLRVARRTPAGWLARSADGTWQCRGLGNLPDVSLWALLPGPGMALNWQAVGKALGGRIELHKDEAPLFVEGWPVFAGGGPR